MEDKLTHIELLLDSRKQFLGIKKLKDPPSTMDGDGELLFVNLKILSLKTIYGSISNNMV